MERHRIFADVSYWRENGIPIALEAGLKDKGIDTKRSIYLEYEQNFPGVSTDQGTVLTPEGEFYKFEMDLNISRTEVVEFYVWENITTKVEINEHKPGSGATWGFLALGVLAELNYC